ncbi:gustatory receptor for sugar taste 64a-like [Haliotis asinina]|uniref:gustatory receptor for sugar taste 64a-like n=1 Tax=Haliotis asinina TaxID=109174 RepID=UPI0035327C50
MLQLFQNTVGTSSDVDDGQETLARVQRLIVLSGLSWDYKKSGGKCNISSVAACIYSSAICMVYILLLIQTIPYYVTADSFTDTCVAILGSTVIVLSLIYWALSTNIHSKIRAFSQCLHEARLRFKSPVPNPLLKKRVVKACLCLRFLAAFSFAASGINVAILTDAHSEYYWPVIVLSAVYGGCNILLYHSILLLFLSISLLLTYEYDVCTQRLVQASEGSVKEEEIEDIRDHHALLTDLVDHVCSFISIHVTVAYLSSVLILCFCLYIIINGALLFQNIGAAAYVVYYSTLNLITLTYLGIRLHEAAHRPLNILHDLAGRKMSERVIGLVTLFANKLSQRQIGISASGLVTITKDTVLTVIGTLLTYVFFVIQFKPEAGLRQNADSTAGCLH